jgi:ribA/ribD-fused uncharacterized protein
LEHYYQGIKFTDPPLREAIRVCGHPLDARKLAKTNRRRARRDWKAVRKTKMTRGVNIECRANPEAAEALLRTGSVKIVETGQYDYYWGCGSDLRGENTFGQVLMEVRSKLRELER